MVIDICDLWKKRTKLYCPNFIISYCKPDAFAVGTVISTAYAGTKKKKIHQERKDLSHRKKFTKKKKIQKAQMSKKQHKRYSLLTICNIIMLFVGTDKELVRMFK